MGQKMVKKKGGQGWLDMVWVEGKITKHASSSGIFTGLYCMEHVLWLVAIAMVVPHLQIEPLQVHCVLLGVEKRAADSLLPNAGSHHLQEFHVRAQFYCNVLVVLATLGYQLRAAQTSQL